MTQVYYGEKKLLYEPVYVESANFFHSHQFDSFVFSWFFSLSFPKNAQHILAYFVIVNI